MPLPMLTAFSQLEKALKKVKAEVVDDESGSVENRQTRTQGLLQDPMDALTQSLRAIRKNRSTETRRTIEVAAWGGVLFDVSPAEAGLLFQASAFRSFQAMAAFCSLIHSCTSISDQRALRPNG